MVRKGYINNLQAKGTTFLSVGHRSTLANYHQSLLELSQDKTWQIKQPLVLVKEQPELLELPSLIE